MLSGKRKTIGVFVNHSDRYFSETVNLRIRQEALRLGYDVIVFHTVGNHRSSNDYDNQEKGMYRFAPVEELDGILVAPDTYEVQGFREGLTDMLRNRVSCPIVGIRTHAFPWDCVFTDETMTAPPILRHLIEVHGLKRICFMAGYVGHADSDARLLGYYEVMAACGLAIPEHAIFRGTMWSTDGPAAYRHYFVDHAIHPEAIVCANDYMARGLIEEMKRHGLRVPEDVIVTGVDHVDSAGTNMISLTTIEQDYDTIARRGMEQLDRRIRDREGNLPEKEMIGIPGRLILGESCGCGKTDLEATLREGSQNARQLSELRRMQENMTYTSMDLSASDTLEQLHSAILKKANEKELFQDLYLCLFEKEDGERGRHRFAQEMTDRACMVSVTRDGQDMGMPMISFDRRQILPARMIDSPEPQMFYLVLLHHQENTFGYTLTTYAPGKQPNSFFQQWNILISGALRSIHNRHTLQQLYEERRISSITDVMTHMNNRRGLEEKLEPIWNQLVREGERVAFVYFDMDRLKYINDHFGHSAGDFAICMVARAIDRSVPRDGIAARMGGDEFLVVMTGATEQQADAFIEDFRGQLEKLNQEENRSFRVECSCGARVLRPDQDMTLEKCIQESDRKMYDIKIARHAQRKD